MSTKPITVKEISDLINDLSITSRQKEFLKACIRTLIEAALSKRLKCKVSI